MGAATAGRKATSNAIARRTLHLDMPSYTKDEMLSIFQQQYHAISKDELEALINAHINKPHKHSGKIVVERTFRDLQKDVELWVKNRSLKR